MFDVCFACVEASFVDFSVFCFSPHPPPSRLWEHPGEPPEELPRGGQELYRYFFGSSVFAYVWEMFGIVWVLKLFGDCFGNALGLF